MTIEEAKAWREDGNALSVVDWLIEEYDRLTAEISEKEGEIGRLNGKIAMVEAESNTISEHLANASHDLFVVEKELKSWKSLAASRLADQEAIERHVTKRVAGECAKIAETLPIWGEWEDSMCDYDMIAAEIRHRYGVTE